MLTKAENIPQELKDLPQWVCAWNGGKCPMRAWEMRGASSSDPETWVDFNFAIQATAYDWCGFVFADNGYVGIDIDCGYDEDGFISQVGADIIGRCKSYTERSRSGRGFHILLRGELPFEGANNRNGVEIYKSKRYFIMTGDMVLYGDITDNQAAIDYVVETYFKDVKPIRHRAAKGETKVLSFRNYSPTWLKPCENGKVKIRPYYPEVGKGGRNVSMLSLAGTLWNLGYNKEQILGELRVANKTACKPPLSDVELQRICKSITRYEQ